MHLVWSDEAVEDLEEIGRYIMRRNSVAADRIVALIENAAEALLVHPYIHRLGRAPATREAVVHPNYVIVYRVGVDAIDILAVLHARQQYP